MTWSDVIRPPSSRVLRQFAGALAVLGGAAIIVSIVRQTANPDALHPVLRTVGLLLVGLGVLGVIRPGAMRWLFLASMVVAFPIGFVVSHVLLGILFYGVFLATGLLLRARGWDAMVRRKDPRRTSYWIPRSAPADLRRYLRQY